MNYKIKMKRKNIKNNNQFNNGNKKNNNLNHKINNELYNNNNIENIDYELPSTFGNDHPHIENNTQEEKESYINQLESYIRIK